MNKPRRYNYAEARLRVERVHRNSEPQAMANIHVNVMVKHAGRVIAEWMGRQLEPHGLSYSSYIALVSLSGLPPEDANPSELCLCTGETRANMTRICDELVAKGLIDRITSMEDRRRVDLTVTSRGQALLDEVMPALRSRLGQVLGVLSPEEKGQLEQLMIKLMRAFEAELG